MIDWWSSRALAVDAIRARRARLKILLKTKDDAYFLDRWIRHHAAIVGLENLIVFDNCSSDPAVARSLRRYGSDLLTIRYKWGHNNIHNVGVFAPLYTALAESCERFLFLDTDEFLCLVRGHHHYADSSVLDYIAGAPQASTVPATWLWCIPRFADVFTVGRDIEHLAEGLRWGKPLLPSRLPLSGHVNHNVQLPSACYSESIPTGLFVLHRAHLSAAQRIAGNLRKLVSRRFCDEDTPLDELLARDLSAVQDPNIRLYVSEIRRLRDIAEPDPAEPVTLESGQIHLRPNSTVHFFGEAEMFLLFEFLQADTGFLRAALKHV